MILQTSSPVCDLNYSNLKSQRKLLFMDKNYLSTHFDYLGSGSLIKITEKLVLPSYLTISFRENRKDMGCIQFIVGKATLFQIVSLNVKEYSLPFSMLIEFIDEFNFEISPITENDLYNARVHSTPLNLMFKGEELITLEDLYSFLHLLSDIPWVKMNYGKRHLLFKPFTLFTDLQRYLADFNNF